MYNSRAVISSHCTAEFTTFVIKKRLFDRCFNARANMNASAQLITMCEMIMEIGIQADETNRSRLVGELMQANMQQLSKVQICALLLHTSKASIFGLDIVEATEWNRRLRVQLLNQQKNEAALKIPLTEAPDLATYNKEVVLPLLKLLAKMSEDFNIFVEKAKYCLAVGESVGF